MTSAPCTSPDVPTSVVSLRAVRRRVLWRVSLPQSGQRLLSALSGEVLLSAAGIHLLLDVERNEIVTHRIIHTDKHTDRHRYTYINKLCSLQDSMFLTTTGIHVLVEM